MKLHLDSEEAAMSSAAGRSKMWRLSVQSVDAAQRLALERIGDDAAVVLKAVIKVDDATGRLDSIFHFKPKRGKLPFVRWEAAEALGCEVNAAGLQPVPAADAAFEALAVDAPYVKRHESRGGDTTSGRRARAQPDAVEGACPHALGVEDIHHRGTRRSPLRWRRGRENEFSRWLQLLGALRTAAEPCVCRGVDVPLGATITVMGTRAAAKPASCASPRTATVMDHLDF